MRKLKLELQTSLDGYMASEDGSTNWMLWDWTEEWNWDPDLRQYHIDLTTSSDCILLSRKMADGFIAHWEKVAEDISNPQYAFAKPICDMQKLVFTKTLERSGWKNTRLIKGDFRDEINKLKDQKGKDLIVYGGASFVSSLIQAKLIDEFHLFINPTALGSGLSVFSGLREKLNLRLSASVSYTCGMVVNKYEPIKN